VKNSFNPMEQKALWKLYGRRRRKVPTFGVQMQGRKERFISGAASPQGQRSKRKRKEREAFRARPAH